MGIYERDYNRAGDSDSDRIGFHVAQLSLTTKLVIVMFAVYFVQLATRPANYDKPPFDQGWFTSLFELHADFFYRPWQAFQLLTYGFLHDGGDIMHILSNMLGLWLFGRALEERYGPREFLLFFLGAVVFGGLCWAAGEVLLRSDNLHRTVALGASAGVVGIVILFAFNYPRQTVLFMFVIPMPMWLLGVLIVLFNAKGSLDSGSQVAYTAHLGGAAFAALYYKWGIQLSKWVPHRWQMPRLRARPKLRVHDPDDDETADESAVVDDILRKISAHGLDSLSRRERQILEQQSREEQRKRRDR